MKNIQPTLIAFPGEKRNATMMKQLFSGTGLIWDFEMEQEVFDIKKLGARCVSMRTPDAVRYLLQWKIAWVIWGIDALTDGLLGSRMKLRREKSLASDFASSIIGYDMLPPRESMLIDDANIQKGNMKTWIEIAWVFDTAGASTLRLLVRNEDENNLANIENISRRWDILTSYPYLVRTLLAQSTGSGNNVWSIRQVDGKTEALLASWFGKSAVDIVVSGETAKMNNLTIWPTLFESYPAFVVREDMQDANKWVKRIARAMNELSNALYYDSWDYKKRYPRG